MVAQSGPLVSLQVHRTLQLKDVAKYSYYIIAYYFVIAYSLVGARCQVGVSPMPTQDETAVSVIVCNYNYGRYLRDGLESLAGQSHVPRHLIIVDDGSSDDSAAVISDFLATDGDRFAARDFIRNKTNLGKLASLNRAVERLATPLVLILDADDTLPPRAIERMSDRLLAARRDNPDVGFVYSDSHLVDEGGAVIGRGKSASWSRALLNSQSYIPECALTLSRALREAAPFDETIRVHTKHHKWTRIAEAGWIGHYIPEPLFNYRMHESNLSGIGLAVLSEDDGDGRRDRLLSGYWRTAGSDAARPGAK